MILLALRLVVLLLVAAAKAEDGLASWYAYEPVACPGMHAGKGFAAHKTLPCGTRVRVTAGVKGTRADASIVVVISDRGPFNSRIIDLNPADFSKLAPLDQGVVAVTIERE